MTVYNGQHRLFNQESFGYSTLQIDTPYAPSALRYDDLRNSGVPAAGDGQSYTFGSSVSPDGLRAAIGLGGPGDGWGIIVGQVDFAEGFRFTGSFGIDRASAVITQTASRYIVYGISTGGSSVVDATVLPAAMVRHNMDATAQSLPWAGYLPKAVGGYVLFLSGSGLTIVDGSTPGPPGAITTGMPMIVLTSTDFGGRGIQYYTAETNGTGLYVLIEARPLAGEFSYTYYLVSITKAGLSKTIMGSWKIPTLPGETWAPAGVSAAISNGKVFMPALRMAPAYQTRAYSTAIGGFPGTPASVDVTGISSFGMPAAWKGQYVFLPTGAAGYVVTCGTR
jgi:hypothetical protein